MKKKKGKKKKKRKKKKKKEIRKKVRGRINEVMREEEVKHRKIQNEKF